MANPLDALNDDPTKPKPTALGGFEALGGAAAPKPPTAPPMGVSTGAPPMGDVQSYGVGAQNTGTPAAAKPPAAPTPTPPVGGTPPAFDPNAVWGNLTQQFQTKHGRAMTAEEAKALQGYAGYTGGEINQGMIDKATQGINAYTGNLANPFGPATPATTGGTATPAPVDPAAATGSLAQTQLQQLMTTGSTDAMSNVDMNNPAIVAQRTAFERGNDRARGRERLAAAERAAARGTLGTGGFDANLAAAEQGAGDRAVDFESQLMRSELQGQRDRVQNAIQLATQSGDAAQARALQERLATIDNQLRKEGMTMQNKLGQGQLGLGLLQALLGDKRAGDALGFNYAALGQQANMGMLDRIFANL